MIILFKYTRWVGLLLATLVLLLLLPVSSVLAVSSTPGVTTWPSQTITDANKVWTISFKSPCLSTSININTIYVKNSSQVKIATTATPSADGLSVKVTPNSPYPAGEYNLYITTGVTSKNNVKLNEQIIFPFTVESLPTASKIIDVKSTFNSYVTGFTVKTAPSVYKVNVNKETTMQYSGASTYNAGVYGLTQGSTITIDAYDQNGVLLQTYNYKL